MAKRKLIAGVLSVLLIVFFNTNLPFELPKANANGATSSFFSLAYARDNHATQLLSSGKHTVKKEHIKVRYKGSECCFLTLPFNFSRREFYVIKALRFSVNNEIVLSLERSLFKLRGPPPSTPINTPNNLFAA